MNTDREQQTKQSRWGFRGMTVRNWLELLIVPLVLVGIGLLFEMQQAGRQQATEKQQQALAEQRAQDEALQAYLNQMSGLLLERDLRASEKGSEVRTLARARTLTVMGTLDPSGKTALMQFLVEADVIQRVDGRDPIISLRGADPSGADLSGADLSGADLSEANLSLANLREANLFGTDLSEAFLSDAKLRGANLREADLGNANLGNANLREANLREADLSAAILSNADLREANLREADLRKVFSLREADLSDANLSDANLREAELSLAILIGADLHEATLHEANLSGAVLEGAILMGADLREADLSGANLSGANLSGATGITNEELEQQAISLKGATMPNGQQYEDWLKSKSRKENKKSDGSS